MSLPEIHNPILFDLSFVDIDSSPPPVSHELLEKLEQQVIDGLPMAFQMQFQQLLDTPLDQLFDGVWQGMQSDVTTQVATVIKGQEANAKNITVNLPPRELLASAPRRASAISPAKRPGGSRRTG